MGAPIKELGGRTWEELEVVQHDHGQLMFPAKLRRRNAKGEVVEKPVRVRAPDPSDLFDARVEARAFFNDKKLDPDRDKDQFDIIEDLFQLSKAIRTFDPPHSQYATPAEVMKFDEGCLKDIKEQINVFKTLLDPRASAKTEEEVWRLIVAVARENSIVPLVDIDGQDQPICVTRMALEACRSPTGQRWLQSFGISIPGLSLPASSAPS